jgi:uncharacterized protein YceH (UPF0502 family)
MDSAILSATEQRVLGSLVEKQVTTPDYYPLSLNALTNACNQSSNREPVVSFDETAVVRALNLLREKKLAYLFDGAQSRVPRYGHRFAEVFELAPPETAILCELMLRGPQTVGELRGRASRMHAFEALSEVEGVLEGLATRSPKPLVVKLARQSGMKECRYAHLLGGEVRVEPVKLAPRPETATIAVRVEDGRIGRLEAEVADLRRELGDVRDQLARFRQQFE